MNNNRIYKLFAIFSRKFIDIADSGSILPKFKGKKINLKLKMKKEKKITFSTT